jgi:hypothetical protein
MLVPACLILVLYCLPLPARAQAQEPNFSNTTDILNGQRHMLRADDVALVYQDVAQQAPYTNTLYTVVFLTGNSQITQEQFMTTTATWPSAPPNAEVQVAMGRMYDQPTDMVAMVTQEANPSQPGWVALYLTVYDRANNRSQRLLLGSGNPAEGADVTPISTLMADFTGDGFDDLVVSSSEDSGDTVVLKAADPKNWAAGLVVGPHFFYSLGPVPGFADMAADVDGDGQLEIVATVSNMLPPANGPQLVVLGVDPQTLTITQQAVTNVGTGDQAVQVVSGNYHHVRVGGCRCTSSSQGRTW